MKSDLVKMLEKLGLNALESEVYLAILKNAPVTAYKIGSTLKTRTAVYPTLEKLRKKKLIYVNVEKNKTYYSAKEIKTFLNEKAEEMQAVESNILLLAKSYMNSKSTSTKIFQGRENIVDAIRYGTRNYDNKIVYCIYPSSSRVTINPKETIYYNENVYLNKKGITKIIISDTSVRPEYKDLDEKFNYTRYSPKHIMSTLEDLSKKAIGIEVFETGIVKIYFYKESYIIIIENNGLAQFAINFIKSLIV